MIWPLIIGAAAIGTAGFALVSANARETGHESKEEDVEEYNEELTEEKIGISSPWVEYYRKVDALFGMDDEVAIEYDEDENSIKMLVGNPTKAEAIDKIMPDEVEFGNVKLTVEVIPANDDVTVEQLFRTAFEGNPAFAGTVVNEKMGNTYALFEADVAQFFNDNFASPYGVTTMSYEDIARDVFGDNVSAFISSAPMVG